MQSFAETPGSRDWQSVILKLWKLIKTVVVSVIFSCSFSNQKYSRFEMHVQLITEVHYCSCFLFGFKVECSAETLHTVKKRRETGQMR